MEIWDFYIDGPYVPPCEELSAETLALIALETTPLNLDEPLALDRPPVWMDIIQDTPLTEVFPLAGIPVETDTPVHDGIHPCGDPTCPCATYGYDEQEDNTPWYTRPDVNPWTDPYWR